MPFPNSPSPSPNRHVLTIYQAASIVRRHVGHQPILFRVITLQEPPKAAMMPYLDYEHGLTRHQPETPPRVAMVHAYVDKVFSEFKVELGRDKVIAHDALHGRHGHIDAEHMRQAELACLAHPAVKEAIAALALPDHATVVIEPWTYAPDGMNDMTERITMVSWSRLTHPPTYHH